MKPLKRIRKRSGLKVKDVIQALKVDRIHYWRIENGTGAPSLTLARKIVSFWASQGYPISMDEKFFPRPKPVPRKAKKVAA